MNDWTYVSPEYANDRLARAAEIVEIQAGGDVLRLVDRAAEFRPIDEVRGVLLQLCGAHGIAGYQYEGLLA